MNKTTTQPVGQTGKTRIKRRLAAAASLLLFTAPALADGSTVTMGGGSVTEQTLATPPPSTFADTESSANLPLADWPQLGRRVKLTLSFHATPSNNVQVAFGQDTNENGNLEPEETQLVLGVDCGVAFAREEAKAEGEGERWRVRISSAETEQGEGSLPSPSTFTFTFRQPYAVDARLNFAKVTVRGRGETAAEIAAEITRPGMALFLR